MAIAESSLSASAEPTRTLDVALEGLASVGYRVDVSMWERFVDAGLLHRPDKASPHLILVGVAELKRFRAILDLELRLGSPATNERLAFYLCAAGVADLPAAAVVDFMEAGIAGFFDACGTELRALPNLPTRIGLDGERALSTRLASALLVAIPRRDRRAQAVLQFLTELGCALFLRAAWRNRAAGRGPAPRIVTDMLLEPDPSHISIMSAGRPLKSSAAERFLPPVVDLAHVIEELRLASRFRPSDIAAAAADAVTVIDRGAPDMHGPKTDPLLHALVPLLAAAFARVRASAKPHFCERIAKSAWAEPDAMRRALLSHWS
jgi:hypothetical protein